jgi:hypothetical protein
MIQHELLAACLGYGGGVIAEGADGFRVSQPGQQLLTSSEIQAVNRVAKLGSLFSKLSRVSRGPQLAGGKDSLYHRAFRRGMGELLDAYSSDVASAEKGMAEDPSLGVSHIHAQLRKWQAILPAMSSLCDVTEGRTGGELLGVLQAASTMGGPEVTGAIQRLQWHCHQVLFQQVAAWCIHGVLLDPHGELFIERSALPASSSQRRVGWEEVLGAVAGRSSGEEAEASWNDDYVVARQTTGSGSIPSSLIPPPLIQKILFVGKSMRLLQRAGSASAGKDGTSPGGAIEEEGLNEAMFYSLAAKPVFHLMSLEAAVDSAYTAVTGKLWRLMVEGARLPMHLQAVRDYLLLGKGHLFHALAVEGRSIFMRPPSQRALLMLSSATLGGVARATGLEDDEFFKRCRLSFDAPEFRKEDFTSAEGFHVAGGASRAPAIGQVRLCRPSAEGGGDAAGALWFGTKREMIAGFDTEFVVKYSAAAQGGRDGPGGVCLVLQPLSCRALGLGGAGLGSEGIADSLAVCLELPGLTGRAGSVFIRTREGVLERAALIGSGVSHGPKLLRIRVTCSAAQDLSATVAVFARTAGEDATASSPLLSTRVDLQQSLNVPASGHGGAFAGLTASSAGGGLSLSVLSWSWSPLVQTGPAFMQGWDRLRMNYVVEWPLHLVLTREALAEYGRLFALLFAVKRAAIELEQAWPELAQSRLLRAGEGSPSLAPLLLLRAKTANFVSCLEYYLQVDVVEANYADLSRAVASAADFPSIQRAHSHFLSSIRHLSFIDVPMLSAAMDAPLCEARALCSLLATHTRSLSLGGGPPLSEVQRLSLQFEDDMRTLLRRAGQVGAQQLLLRLNYNGYYKVVLE